jgi:hypothetical protein
MDISELPNDVIDLILTFSSLDVAVHCRNTFAVKEKTLADSDAFHKFFSSVVSLHDSLTVSYLCGLATRGLIPCDFYMLVHFVHTAHIGCLPMFKLLHRYLGCALTKVWYEHALCHAAHEGHVSVVRYILDAGVIPCHEQPVCLAWYFAEKARPWFTGAPSQKVLAYLSTKMPSLNLNHDIDYKGESVKHMFDCLPYIFEATCDQPPCRCCIL